LDQVAAALGYSKGHLSNIENNKGVASIGLLLRLAVLFGAPLSELVPDDETLRHTEIAYGADEVELVRALRRMAPEAKRGLLALMRSGSAV
jgi:transcriptional regulator with XRE-family HTH domain